MAWIGKKATKAIRYALYLAIQWEESLIDAYAHIDDEDGRRVKDNCKGNIKTFTELRKKLKGM